MSGCGQSMALPTSLTGTLSLMNLYQVNIIILELSCILPVDLEHVKNCAELQSAIFNLLWQTYYCDDGYDLVPLCQLPK